MSLPDASISREEYMQLLHEKAVLASRLGVLEADSELTQNDSEEQQARISDLEKRLRQQQRDAEAKAEEARMALELQEELDRAKAELAATRRNLKHTQSDLTKVKTNFEVTLQEQQELAARLEDAARTAASRPSQEAVVVTTVAAEPALDAEALAALEAAKEAEMQALRDRLDEEAERTRQLQQLLDQRELLADQQALEEESLGDSLAAELGQMASMDQGRVEAEAAAAAEVTKLREAAAADLRAMEAAKDAAAAEVRRMEAARAREKEERERVEAELRVLQQQMEQARTAQEKVALEAQVARQEAEAAAQALAQREAEDARLAKEKADREYAEGLRRAFEEDQRRAEAAKADALAKQKERRLAMLKTLCKMFPSIPPKTVCVVLEHHGWQMDASCQALAKMVESAAKGAASPRRIAVQPTPTKEQAATQRQQATKARLAQLLAVKKKKAAEEAARKEEQARRDAQRKAELERAQRERQGAEANAEPLFYTRSPPQPQPQPSPPPAGVRGLPTDSSLAYSKDMRRDSTFKVVLPSQEKFYDVLVEDTQDAQFLGLGRKWTADCTLKCSPTYLTLSSKGRFRAVVEWPLGLVKIIREEKGSIAIEAWMDRMDCTALVKMQVERSKEVFHVLQKLIKAFEDKEDKEIALELKQEEEKNVEIGEAFLREIRANEDFNKLLAKDRKVTTDNLKATSDVEYRQALGSMGKKTRATYRKLRRTMKKNDRRKRLLGRKRVGVAPQSPSQPQEDESPPASGGGGFYQGPARMSSMRPSLAAG